MGVQWEKVTFKLPRFIYSILSYVTFTKKNKLSADFENKKIL